jgi:drug/metabolite transporter (DMT)-like permease
LRIAVLGPLATYLSLWALKHAEVAALAPWDYSRLVISTMAAIVIFHEMPSGWAWGAGMAAIIAGCLMQLSRR